MTEEDRRAAAIYRIEREAIALRRRRWKERPLLLVQDAEHRARREAEGMNVGPREPGDPLAKYARPKVPEPDGARTIRKRVGAWLKWLFVGDSPDAVQPPRRPE